MCFVEPIVCLFAICVLRVNNYVCLFIICQNDFIRHYFFAKIFVKLFLQHNSYPDSKQSADKFNGIQIYTYQWPVPSI